jgi:tetratricopeptide (TPR) repeat protein
LLSGEIDCDEELKSTLYWLAEIHWFAKEKKQEILTHDEAIKSLYHLCFVNPDRAGFLEIDSQFFSEFGPVNEIAEEGFLFKEALVEAVLELWESYEGWFDGVFQFVLEALTGRKSKIYDERQNWVRFWKYEKAQFSRDYLYIVEGNLSFSQGQIEEAKFCYQKALEISPQLRAGVFNLLYVAAKLKDEITHEWAIQEICKNQDWLPLGLSAIGNSYFILEKDNRALEYYDKLRQERGWEKKVDFYISLFCLEIGNYDRALSYAKKAHELNPLDSSMSFHLSRCYSKVGAKEAALEVFNKVNGVSGKAMGQSLSSAWMVYYRFTLERDSGRDEEAIKTLMQLPREYFQDPEELAEAMEFAKRKQDLRLLRHLKTAG